MVERHWNDVRGNELRYQDHTWELTGDVDVMREGDVVAATGRNVDGVQHDRARLYFGLENPPDSLNPGDAGDCEVSLRREGDERLLRVETPGRTYRYLLQRMEYR